MINSLVLLYDGDNKISTKSRKPEWIGTFYNNLWVSSLFLISIIFFTKKLVLQNHSFSKLKVEL